MTDIICAVISGFCAIAVAYIGKRLAEHGKKDDRQTELRRRESLLSLEMMDATLKLSIVTANALTGGHNNGNVEQARLSAHNAGEKYEHFLRETAAYDVG